MKNECSAFQVGVTRFLDARASEKWGSTSIDWLRDLAHPPKVYMCPRVNGGRLGIRKQELKKGAQRSCTPHNISPVILSESRF